MRRSTVIITALAAGLVASTANAQDAALRQACGADVRTLCAGIMPGGGRIKQCMIEKFDQLSDGCKAALKDKQALQGSK